jgi:hypothetical protein
LHSLSILDQTDRGGKLRVLRRRSESRHGLRVCYVRGHFENFFREMIDAIEKTASPRDKNAGTEVIEEWFLLESAFEELEGLADSQVNDRVQRLALDLLPGKTGIAFSKIVSPGRQLPRMQLPSSIFNFSERAIGMRRPIEMSLVIWSPPIPRQPLCLTAPSTYKM